MARSTMSSTTKLFISNLDLRVTDEDICELFSEFGTIKEATVHYNRGGSSIGTGHVIYVNREDALLAERHYQGVALDGKPMVISALPCPNHNLNPSVRLPATMRLSYVSNGARLYKRHPREPTRYFEEPMRLSREPKRNYYDSPHPHILKNPYHPNPASKGDDVNDVEEDNESMDSEPLFLSFKKRDLDQEKFNNEWSKRLNGRLATSSEEEDDLSDLSPTANRGYFFLDDSNVVSDENSASTVLADVCGKTEDLAECSTNDDHYRTCPPQRNLSINLPLKELLEQIRFEKVDAEHQIEIRICYEKGHSTRETEEELRLFLDGLEDETDTDVGSPTKTLNNPQDISEVELKPTEIMSEEMLKDNLELEMMENPKHEDEMECNFQKDSPGDSPVLSIFRKSDVTTTNYSGDPEIKLENEGDSSSSSRTTELSDYVDTPKSLPDVINTEHNNLEICDAVTADAYPEERTTWKPSSLGGTATRRQTLRVKKSKSVGEECPRESTSQTRIRKSVRQRKQNQAITDAVSKPSPGIALRTRRGMKRQTPKLKRVAMSRLGKGTPMK